MATQVYLVKRSLRERRKNGQKKTRWALRWEDPATGRWKCEATRTADRTEADTLRREKWAELNGLTPPKKTEPSPEVAGPSWDECRAAVRKAMEADRCSDDYVRDAVNEYRQLQKAFPEVNSPAGITPKMAQEYKQQKSDPERGLSPWSVKSDLNTIKAVFGKWLVNECGLLKANPFAGVRPPKCDQPDVRIVTKAETEALMNWMAERWNNWRLPLVYLEVAAIVGWRANEIASIRTEDILADGFIRVAAKYVKTRRTKIGKLPSYLHAELQSCAADGWAFGRFSDDLRRLLVLAKKRPHHAARVQDFAPKRLVAWLQDELQRFNDLQQAAATEAGRPIPDRFTMHDFRKTATTGMQMAGVSEKDAAIQLGVSPEIMRRHYEALDQMTIATRNLDCRFSDTATLPFNSVLRARCARPENASLDEARKTAEADIA